MSYFSDDEIKRRLGLKRRKKYDNSSKPLGAIASKLILSIIPKNFDSRRAWPKCTVMRSVKDQGSCGSCWVNSSQLPHPTYDSRFLNEHFIRRHFQQRPVSPTDYAWLREELPTKTYLPKNWLHVVNDARMAVTAVKEVIQTRPSNTFTKKVSSPAVITTRTKDASRIRWSRATSITALLSRWPITVDWNAPILKTLPHTKTIDILVSELNAANTDHELHELFFFRNAGGPPEILGNDEVKTQLSILQKGSVIASFTMYSDLVNYKSGKWILKCDTELWKLIKTCLWLRVLVQFRHFTLIILTLTRPMRQLLSGSTISSLTFICYGGGL